MREQVVTTRGGRGGAAATRAGRGGAREGQQRPPARAKRAGGASQPAQNVKKRARGNLLRRLLGYAPLALKILLAVAAGVLAYKGYRAATSASFFRLQRVEVVGTDKASPERIRETVERAALDTGVWNADLDRLSRELRSLPWVRSATVARVLPSALRVRVTEREPRVIARNLAGRLAWVDDEGVALGTASPSEQDFIVRGLDEATTEFAREQNRERVARALEMKQEWSTVGHAERISEVNLDDLRDVRAHLSGANSQIEVRLGDRDFGRRLVRALKALAEVPADSPRGAVIYLDATRDKGVTVGFDGGARGVPVEGSNASGDVAARPEESRDASGATPPARNASLAADGGARKREDVKSKRELKEQKEQKQKERRPAEKPRAVGADGATRPRRAVS
ncbi:MAG TPA: FtsQ-type POTRA domain-containing protein [Pyrinomonadaceae bacterium]|nr:FtsQ-type POTRA domain-containing protein [Pyrinomonadaceae bacterium]